jgi:molybdopterin-guanine dinucleotide biosynthesis protein A
MGTDKSRLIIGGETLAQRAIRTLAAVYTKVTSVGGKRVGNEPHIDDVSEFTLPGQAAIIGVHAALSHSKTEWTAVLACDLPFVTPELFDKLNTAALTAPANKYAVVPVQPEGRIQPLCALYRTEPCLSAVESAIGANNLKLVRLLDSLEPIEIGFSEFCNLEYAKQLFMNVNTPEDLRRAREFRHVS